MQPSNGDAFRRRVAGMGIAEVICSPASPWQNPYAERVIGSIRRECLDHVIVFGEAHLRRLIFAYVAYYHRSRTHLGLGKDTPDGRPSNRQAPDGSSRFPKSVVSIPDTSVARRKRHVPSLTVESTPCFEYSRLALHLGGLPRFSRAPSQLGVHSAARSTSFNPFEYARGSAR